MDIKDRHAAVRTTLEQELQSATSPRDRLSILIELAKELDPHDPDAARQFAQEGLRIAVERKDQFWIARSLRATGTALMRSGHYSEALLSLRKAAKIFERNGELYLKAQTNLAIADTRIVIGELNEAVQLILECRNFFEKLNDLAWTAFTLRSLGDFYKAVGDHSNVIGYYRQAIAVAGRAGLKSELGEMYLRLAEGYRQMEDKGRERHYLLKSLTLARDTHSIRGVARAIAGLAAFHISTEQWERAGKYVRLSIRLSRALGQTDQEGLAWGMLGTIYVEKKDFTKALFCFRKGLHLTERSENPLCRGLLYEKMGSLYVKLKQYDHGLTALRRGLAMIEKSGQTFYLFQIHEKLTQACELVGDTAGALHHFKEFARIKDDHLDSRKFLEASRLDMQRKLRKAADRLERKRAQNKTLTQWIEEKETELIALTRQLLNKPQNNEKETARAASGSRQPSGMLRPENWEIFTHRFHKVHHGFHPQLVRRYPDLTPTEIKVCSLIRIGLSSKEIAEILCISKRTVDNHRARVHKKMRLPQGSSLTGFIAQL